MKYVFPTDLDGNSISFVTVFSRVFDDDGRTINDRLNDIIPCTYIVNSNKKLLDWANNESGNDYSHVFVAPGTYTVNKSINLTTTGTYTIDGTFQSNIVFNGTYRGFYYDALSGFSSDDSPRLRFASHKYYIKNLNVTLINTNSDGANHDAIMCCCNLFNVNVLINVTSSVIGFGSNGISDSYRVDNCAVESHCTGEGGNAKGFVGCHFLTNCYSDTMNDSDASATSKSCVDYSLCERLFMCIGRGVDTESQKNRSSCTYDYDTLVTGPTS